MGDRREPQGAATMDRVRDVVRVARLYHVLGVGQRDIARRLRMSQPRVSRLLQLGEELGIVRTEIMVPEGLRPDLEDGLEEHYGVLEAHVVEISGGDPEVARVLGGAAARYISSAPVEAATIGFTSWSLTLREMAWALEGSPFGGARHVVEMLGDLGAPWLQHEADRATMRLAGLVGAEPIFLRVPGVMATAALRDAALQDPHVSQALGLLGRLDVAFVGIGPAAFHSLLREGDNFFTAEQLAGVRRRGAVAQLNQRFVDGSGAAVETPLDDLVVGVTLAQLRSARRRVFVAGGSSKHEALAACLKGGWADVLITDVDSAEYLLKARAVRTGDATAGPGKGRRIDGVGVAGAD